MQTKKVTLTAAPVTANRTEGFWSRLKKIFARRKVSARDLPDHILRDIGLAEDPAQAARIRDRAAIIVRSGTRSYYLTPARKGSAKRDLPFSRD